MRITPCAALDDTFRARCFLLRSIIDFSKVVQALASLWGDGSTLLSLPIVALWPTGRGALLNAGGCIPSRWARYCRLPSPAGLLTALAWRCAAAAPGRVGSPADHVRVAGSCNAGNCCGGVALHGSARKLFAVREGRGAAPCTTVLSMASALSFSSDSAFSTTCCRCSRCHSASSPTERRSRMLRRSSCAWRRIRPASSSAERMRVKPPWVRRLSGKR